jgi:hypothetical protein
LGEPILDFVYADDWYPITDGHGFSLAIVDENGATSNWGLAAGWRPDGVLQGTPGQPGVALPGFPTVVIHEALTHTDLPLVDAIELHNPGATVAAIGGWYLTDDSDYPNKFRIPAGATIPPGRLCRLR